MTSHRIAWLIKGLARGGAERLVTVMVPRLRERGFDIEVFYVAPGADGFVPDLKAAGVKVHGLGSRTIRHTRWIARMARTLRRGRFELVHTHSPLPAAVARVLAPRGVPFVHTEHNMWSAYRAPTILANALTLGRNDIVYAVSDSVRESMRRPWWLRIGSAPDPEVLLHGVDTQLPPRGGAARQAARSLLSLDNHVPVIGHVANLSAKKDQQTLLAAFERLQANKPEAQLVIVGMGPLREELELEVRRLEIEGNVRFLGSRDDVQALLPAFDVFALSSTFEGLPISLLEAMAAEVACVSTAVGGIPEVVHEGLEGRLIPPGDAESMAGVFRNLLDDPEQRTRLGAAARARVSADFSIDRAVERTAEAYLRLLARGDQ